MTGSEPQAIQHISTEGQVPRHFSLLGEDLLIAANQESCSLSFFRRDPERGLLKLLGVHPTEERPFWVGNPESY